MTRALSGLEDTSMQASQVAQNGCGLMAHHGTTQTGAQGRGLAKLELVSQTLAWIHHTWSLAATKLVQAGGVTGLVPLRVVACVEM